MCLKSKPPLLPPGAPQGPGPPRQEVRKIDQEKVYGKRDAEGMDPALSTLPGAQQSLHEDVVNDLTEAVDVTHEEQRTKIERMLMKEQRTVLV